MDGRNMVFFSMRKLKLYLNLKDSNPVTIGAIDLDLDATKIGQDGTRTVTTLAAVALQLIISPANQRSPTRRAPDLGYTPRFLGFFLACADSRFEGESSLPPQAGNANRWATQFVSSRAQK
jgi:hypothetical protein